MKPDQKEICKTCKFFSAFQGDNEKGFCKRFPPTNPDPFINFPWQRVRVMADDICGEWRRK